jgi:quercetin dioxygenase-like cupin family protein
MLEHCRAGAGRLRKLQVCVKATTAQTGGEFNLFEVECPPGFASPLHIHYGVDVAVYVLDGALTVFWGEDKKEVTAGAYLFMPRGTPHGFRVTGEKAARILHLSVPGGLDKFVHERGLWANESDYLAAAARYKIEIMGPLPD